MKDIKDIEGLSLEDLERIAKDESINVPHGLESKAKRNLAWRSLSIPVSIAAAIAVIAGVGLTAERMTRPADSFSDPELAYAELEKTLGYISDKMNAGIAIARNAGPDKADPFAVLNK